MDKFAAETLKAIAEKLIRAREAQGISLNEVSAKTYIPLRILKALEAAETYKLPEPIFVQGFIKRYADLVGLDGTTISHEFPLAQTTSSIPNPVITQAQTVPSRPPEPLLKPPIQAPVSNASRLESGKPSPSSVVPSASSKSAPDRVNAAASNVSTPIAEPIASRSTALQDLPSSWTKSPDRPTEQTHWRLPVLGGLLGVVLLGSILLLLSHNRTPKTTTEPTPSTSATTTSPSPPSASQSIASKSTPSTSQAAPSPSPAPQPGAITVSLNVTDESWVEVEVDGKVATSATLPKGTQKTWSGQKEIIVYSGNAKGVSVSRNQEAAKALGTTADPKGIKFTATGESPL
ncbi:MAG: hypothetical protein B0A82_20745 [Alkalinema sp. CACIAM 70d]|nr:MAG: hypothetical protein B0A82_20745 [Alkalinema sp. CACIAM 70d]